MKIFETVIRTNKFISYTFVSIAFNQTTNPCAVTCFEVHHLILVEFGRVKSFVAVVKDTIILENSFPTVYRSCL